MLRNALICFCLLLVLPMLTVPAFAGEAVQLGEGLQELPVTPAKDILERPDDFIGKTVRVEGDVLDVCPRKGCWAEIRDEDSTLRIKVEDDVIVFPADSVGRVLVAEGVVEAIDQTRDQYVTWLAHLAEEKGETFDVEAAEIGEGPFRRIQIRGVGAQVAAP